ncbi:syntaxin-7 [Euwallacea similis]|uniref:syntaxin-7 n=1 Tax=Euwallacea similis TaxID=1736056 RepID=UPI0034504DAC
MDTYQNGSQNRGEQDFQKVCQTIGSSIQKISQNVSAMQRMVRQIGSHQDSPELRKKLHSVQHYTQQLAKDTNGYIKDLNNIPSSTNPSEQRQRKMLRERLHDEFTTTLNMFQQVQRSTADKEKDQIKKTKQQVYGDQPYLPGFNKKDQQLIELQDGAGRQQAQVQEEADLRQLQEQELAVRQLESDISDVNQIFKELGQLVHEQGVEIDSIEASVESTADYVRQGAQQLREASTYKDRIRKKKLLIAGIGALILAVIIIIIICKTS